MSQLPSEPSGVPATVETGGSASTRAEGLTRAEVAALADVYMQPEAAAAILSAAGLPRSEHPSWRPTNARQFWNSVSEMFASGVLKDGRRRLLSEALKDYPENPAFKVSVNATADVATPESIQAVRRRPMWKLVASSAGAIAVVILVVAIKSFSDDGSASLRVMGLVVRDDSAVAGQDLSTSGTDSDKMLPASGIEVSMANPDSSSALVTKIEIRLVRAESLEVCLGFGGGVRSSERYSVLVPTAQELAMLGERHTLLVPVTRYVEDPNLPFEVGPDGNDKFTLTVGPGGYIDFRGPPWVFVAEIYLHVDGSKDPLFAGTAALTAPLLSGFGEYTNVRIMSGEQRDCARRNLRRLSEAAEFPARGPLAVSEQISLFVDELSTELAQANLSYLQCGQYEGGPRVVLAGGGVSCGEASDVLTRYLETPTDRLEGLLGAYADGDWYCVRPGGLDSHDPRCSNQRTAAVIRLAAAR